MSEQVTPAPAGTPDGTGTAVPATPALPASTPPQAPAGTPAATPPATPAAPPVLPGTPGPHAGQGGTAPDPNPTTPAQPAGTPPVVPEKYDLKLPKDSLLPPARLEHIAAQAKAKGLTNDQAQEVVEREHQARTDYAQEQLEQGKTNNQASYEALKSDPEVGGEKFEQNGTLAYQAATKYFGEEFVAVIKQANLNHHPLLFKGLVRLGRAMAPDQLVVPEGSNASNQRFQRDVDLYDHPTSKK